MLVYLENATFHGFSDWLHLDPGHRISHAPTAGSLRGPEMLLATAYAEQYQEIGWYNFTLGRVRKRWAQTIQAYNKLKKSTGPQLIPEYWTSLLIHHLWTFIKQLWNHRNQIIHGSTGEGVVTRIMNNLQDQVRQHCQQFQDDPTYVLA